MSRFQWWHIHTRLRTTVNVMIIQVPTTLVINRPFLETIPGKAGSQSPEEPLVRDFKCERF